MTAESPSEIKDMVEVFWDPSASGPDERSENGSGMMMKTDGGRRYQLGQWPSDDPHIHQAGALAVSDNPDGGINPPFTPGPEYGANGCLSCS